MNKFVNWKIIFSWLNLPEMDEFQILTEVHNYLRLLNVSSVLKPNFCILPIKDHKADLPDEAQTVSNLAFSYSDLKEIYNQYGEIVTDIFVQSDFYKKTFYLVTPERTSFIQNNCQNCPRPLNECQISVDLIPDTNQLIFPQIRTGTVCISYLTLPTMNDELAIPDDGKLHNAIANYVRYKYWQKEKQMADSSNYNRMNNEAAEAKKDWLISHGTYVGSITSRKLNAAKLGQYQNRVTNIVRSQK